MLSHNWLKKQISSPTASHNSEGAIDREKKPFKSETREAINHKG